MMYSLLLKTHNKTGLKYLCKTEQDDYKNYHGSGKYWKPHLKIHGKDISTELLFETEYKEEFIKIATDESISRDIVKSEEYANLKMEEGDGGGPGDYCFGKKRPDQSEFMIGKKIALGSKRTKEWKEKEQSTDYNFSDNPDIERRYKKYKGEEINGVHYKNGKIDNSELFNIIQDEIKYNAKSKKFNNPFAAGNR